MIARSIFLTFLLLSGISMAQEKSETYRNPVDGKTYVAPGGWNTYQPPQGASPPENKKVNVEGIRLLNAQKDFEERTSVVELAAYLKEVEKVAVSVFSSFKTKAVVLVQFKSVPNKTELKIAHQGGLTNDLLQEFYDQTTRLRPLNVSRGELNYQAEYHIAP